MVSETFISVSSPNHELCLAAFALGAGVRETAEEVAEHLATPAHERVPESQHVGQRRKGHRVGEVREGAFGSVEALRAVEPEDGFSDGHELAKRGLVGSARS
jgi:hypothetical protein